MALDDTTLRLQIVVDGVEIANSALNETAVSVEKAGAAVAVADAPLVRARDELGRFAGGWTEAGVAAQVGAEQAAGAAAGAAAATDKVGAAMTGLLAKQSAALGALAGSESIQAASLAQAGALAQLPVAAEAASLGVVAWFRRMAVGVGEMVGIVSAETNVLTEKMVGAAEASKLSTAGIGGAFGGLSTLLGAGIAVGFMAHFVDETNRAVLELGHLSEKTGINISALSGLQLATRELGVDFGAVEQGMGRLERAQTLAVEGSKQQINAFHRIGLEVKDIRDLSPEELFVKVSEAMQNTAASADRNTSAFTLLGRGGKELIPIFLEYGGAIGEVMTKLGQQNGISEESYREALKLQKMTADLSAELRKLAIEVTPALVFALRALNVELNDVAAGLGILAVKAWEYSAAVIALYNPTKSAAEVKQIWGDNAKYAADMIASLNHQADLAQRSVNELKGGLSELGPLGGPHGSHPERGGPDTPSGEGASDKTDKAAADEEAKLAAIRERGLEHRFIVERRFTAEQEKEVHKRLEAEEHLKEQFFQMDNAVTALFAEQANKRVQAAWKATEEEIRVSEQSSNSQLRSSERFDNERLRSHAIATSHWAEDERAAIERWYNQQHTVLERGLQDAKRIFGEESAEYKKMVDRMLLLDQQRQEKMKQIDQKVEDNEKKSLERFATDFNRAFIQVAEGHEKFGKAMLQVEKKLFEGVASNLMKAVELHGIAGLKEIFIDAKTAGAHAFKSVMEAVPFPANVVLAPIAAAGAFGAVMAFGSFEKGGVIPSTGMHYLHEGEGILTTSQTVNLQQAADKGFSGRQSFHYSPVINAIDSRGVKAALWEHSEEIGKIVRNEMRKGGIYSPV